MICTEHHSCFSGWQDVYQHESSVLKCKMNVAVYLPPQANSQKLPVLYWLSGLTCNEQNFITKAGAQRYAAEQQIILVVPDTSPRGNDVADDEAFDLGQGAGFYINATEEPWVRNYQMYDYIIHELPELIEKNFPVNSKRSISGHSMGGHGALMLALNHPELYCSVSAFAPIVSPIHSPFGQKVFSAYLGDDQQHWQQYDSCYLLSHLTPNGKQLPILIDQGEQDEFLDTQLKPHLLKEMAEQKNYPLTLRMQPGYDHSYYFVTSFIGEHIAYHAKYLR